MQRIAEKHDKKREGQTMPTLSVAMIVKNEAQRFTGLALTQ